MAPLDDGGFVDPDGGLGIPDARVDVGDGGFSGLPDAGPGFDVDAGADSGI